MSLNKILFKRGLKLNIPVLSEGEPAITTDTDEFYFGSSSGNIQVMTKKNIDYIVINVKNFGAKGDGIADDTTPIQNAIDSISLTGGIVLIPSGKYKISSLTLKKGVNLQGVTYNNTFLSGSIMYCNDSVNSAIKVEGSSTIEKLIFYYPNQTIGNLIQYPATIQLLSGNRETLIKDITFINSFIGVNAQIQHELLTMQNVHGYCISQGVICSGSTDIDRFYNVHFNVNTLQNFYREISSIANYLDFAKYSRQYGIAFQIGRADWIELLDCFAFGYRTGIKIVNDSLGYPSIIRIDNTCLDGCGESINQVGGGNYTSVNNGIFTCYNPFEADPSVYTSDFGITINNCDRTIIHKCNMYSCKGGLIRTNCKNINISNNFLDNATNNNPIFPPAIDIQQGALTVNIENNQFLNCTNDALELHCLGAYIIITANNFNVVGAIGILISTNVDNIIIANNIFKANITTISYLWTPLHLVDTNNLIIA